MALILWKGISFQGINGLWDSAVKAVASSWLHDLMSMTQNFSIWVLCPEIMREMLRMWEWRVKMKEWGAESAWLNWQYSVVKMATINSGCLMLFEGLISSKSSNWKLEVVSSKARGYHWSRAYPRLSQPSVIFFYHHESMSSTKCTQKH